MLLFLLCLFAVRVPVACLWLFVFVGVLVCFIAFLLFYGVVLLAL